MVNGQCHNWTFFICCKTVQGHKKAVKRVGAIVTELHLQLSPVDLLSMSFLSSLTSQVQIVEVDLELLEGEQAAFEIKAGGEDFGGEVAEYCIRAPLIRPLSNVLKMSFQHCD